MSNWSEVCGVMWGFWMKVKAVRIKLRSKEVVGDNSIWNKQPPVRNHYSCTEHGTLRTKRRLLWLGFNIPGDMSSGEATVKEWDQNLINVWTVTVLFAMHFYYLVHFLTHSICLVSANRTKWKERGREKLLFAFAYPAYTELCPHSVVLKFCCILK